MLRVVCHIKRTEGRVKRYAACVSGEETTRLCETGKSFSEASHMSSLNLKCGVLASLHDLATTILATPFSGHQVGLRGFA